MFSFKKKRIEYLRSIWGKPVIKFRDMDLISSYHDLLLPKNDNSFVDQQTWNDLEFDSLFSKMDRNISGIGQQYLYHLLHKYEVDDIILAKRSKLVSILKEKRELREQIQLNLFGLSDTPSYFVANLVLNKFLPTTKYYPLFYICSALSIASMLLIPLNSLFLLVTITVLLTNLIINKIFSRKIYECFSGFASLNALIASALSIGKIENETQIEAIEFLKRKRGLLKSLKKKLGYLVIDKESLNDLTFAAIEYLNMFLLFDVISYYRSVNILLKNQEEIHSVFESVGVLDASISIASYLTELPYYTIPSFHASDEISFRELYHPFLQDPVPNTLENISDSVLITGSNMSGKTTFIKTIGINFVLSQTLNFCLAREIHIPKLIVKSTIRRNDDLEEGKSYFFAEIEAIGNFVNLSGNGSKYLFLIDEIFRGTNTIERLASSTAVLKHLDINHKVFVTTHDIELQKLLENNFKMYHFSEEVQDSKFFFSYKIKEGPCSSGNAIKLLELMNFPKSITSEARLLIQKQITDESNKICESDR